MSPVEIFVTLCLLGSAFAADVVAPCSDGGLPDYISADLLVDGKPCDVTPCSFPRGSTAAALITFLSATTTTQINKYVNATVVGTNTVIPFPLPNASKGCDDLQDGSYCPLDRGERARLQIEMPVLAIYPKVELVLKFFIQNQAAEQLACMKVSAVVVDA